MKESKSTDEHEGFDSADAKAEYETAWDESVRNNDKPINWEYWAGMPSLKRLEAAHLLFGVDPHNWKESAPPDDALTDLADQIRKLALLAEREGRDSMTPRQWIAWAKDKGIEPFPFFTDALERDKQTRVDSRSSAQLQASLENAAETLAKERGRRVTKDEAARRVARDTQIEAETIKRRTRKTW